jgi:hypothetical protein
LNVGDSPVYLARNGQLSKLSEDHVEGEMKHVLKRAIGLEPEVAPHYFERELADGDVAFLCSDGVSNVLSAEDLGARLAKRSAARAIVQHARSVAPDEMLDDMSAIVIDIAETGKLRAVTQLPLLIPENLRKGDVIDGYELLRSFQHSDRVWLAMKDGQRWTMKFAPLEARDSEAVLNQFVKETWNATRLHAEYFVEASAPEKATARYYVMEFIEAPSLKALLASRRLAIDEAVELGRFLICGTIWFTATSSRKTFWSSATTTGFALSSSISAAPPRFFPSPRGRARRAIWRPSAFIRRLSPNARKSSRWG